MATSTILKIVLTMLLWALCFPLITVGIEFSPHIMFATLRALIAGSTLVTIAVWLKQPMPQSYSVWALLAAIGLGATTLGFLGMFHAAEFVEPGAATVIANTQPLLAVLLASLLLGERSTSRVKIGLGVGFVGVLVIAAPGLSSDNQGSYALGVGFIVIATLGVCVSNVIIKKVAAQLDGIMAMGLQMLLGSIPLGIWAAMNEDFLDIIWTIDFIIALLSLSLLGTSLVYWLWFTLLSKVALSQASGFSFLIPVIGLAIGAIFFGEAIEWPQIIGLALTLLGVGMVANAKLITKPANPTPSAQP